MAGEVKLTANIPAKVKGINFLWRLCAIVFYISYLCVQINNISNGHFSESPWKSIISTITHASEIKYPDIIIGINILWGICGIIFICMFITILPHFIILFLKEIVFVIFALISMFTILFSGTVPKGMWNFMTKYIRHLYYVSAWLLNFGGKYPKFDGKVDPDQPLQIEFVRPDKWVNIIGLLRMCGIVLLILLPHFIMYIFWAIWVIISIVIGMIIGLFTGKWNKVFSKMIVSFMRFRIRIICYAFCITDTYPPLHGKE